MSEDEKKEKEVYDILIENGINEEDAKEIVKEFFRNIEKKED